MSPLKRCFLFPSRSWGATSSADGAVGSALVPEPPAEGVGGASGRRPGETSSDRSWGERPARSPRACVSPAQRGRRRADTWRLKVAARRGRAGRACPEPAAAASPRSPRRPECARGAGVAARAGTSAGVKRLCAGAGAPIPECTVSKAGRRGLPALRDGETGERRGRPGVSGGVRGRLGPSSAASPVPASPRGPPAGRARPREAPCGSHCARPRRSLARCVPGAPRPAWPTGAPRDPARRAGRHSATVTARPRPDVSAAHPPSDRHDAVVTAAVPSLGARGLTQRPRPAPRADPGTRVRRRPACPSLGRSSRRPRRACPRRLLLQTFFSRLFTLFSRCARRRLLLLTLSSFERTGHAAGPLRRGHGLCFVPNEKYQQVIVERRVQAEPVTDLTASRGQPLSVAHAGPPNQVAPAHPPIPRLPEMGPAVHHCPGVRYISV